MALQCNHVLELSLEPNATMSAMPLCSRSHLSTELLPRPATGWYSKVRLQHGSISPVQVLELLVDVAESALAREAR